MGGSLGRAWLPRAASEPEAPAPQIATGVARVTMDLPEKMSSLRISPDGRSIAYYAAVPASESGDSDAEKQPRQRIYMRRLDRFEAQPIAGTESVWGSKLAFSPDGYWIAFLVPEAPES